MEIEVSKIGERGQIVIPLEFRNSLKLKKGKKMVIFKDNDKLVFQAMEKLKAKNIEGIKEDLEDIRIAGRFWEDIKKGNIVKQSKEEFLKDLEGW